MIAQSTKPVLGVCVEMFARGSPHPHIPRPNSRSLDARAFCECLRYDGRDLGLILENA